MRMTLIERIDPYLPWIGLAIGYAFLALLVLSCGCARFNTTQKDLSYDPKTGEKREITTRATAYTFFEAKSQLANWKASQSDKTQGASVGSLNQESQVTSNITSLVEAIAAGVARGVTK